MAGEEFHERVSRTKGRDATTGVIPGRFALSVGKPELPAPNQWRWVALSEVAQLESGHTPSRKRPGYWDGSTPWIGIKDAVDNHGRVIDDTYQHVSELGLANSSARLLPTRTVCLSRTASVGYVVIMGRPMATSQDFVNWVCGPELEPHYLKYILIAERESLFRFASGTTHQTIYYPEAKAFHALLPSLRTQREILEILGALDDKIELNRRMNQTLEAMARALFKSWFVDFDPVRAKAEGRQPEGMDAETAALFPSRFVDSELGPIPEGWEVKSFVDCGVWLSGGTPSKSTTAYWSGDIPWISAKTLGDTWISSSDRCVTALGSQNGTRLVPEGTVLFVVRGMSLASEFRVGLAARSVTFNQDLKAVVPDKEPSALLYLFLKTQTERILELADEASHGTKRLQTAALNRLALAIPAPGLQHRMAEPLDRLLRRVKANLEELGTLAETRDILLPKLLSGELRVPVAEKMVAEAV